MMPQVEGFAHDAAAVKGDTPATGAWNLGQQTVEIKRMLTVLVQKLNAES